MFGRGGGTLGRGRPAGAALGAGRWTGAVPAAGRAAGAAGARGAALACGRATGADPGRAAGAALACGFATGPGAAGAPAASTCRTADPRLMVAGALTGFQSVPTVAEPSCTMEPAAHATNNVVPSK
ncbi:MAG: hypothetical protein IT375_29270 [Polyangiaceae bacterium]|nr:hypothetical protein [Polyangiaceae bacterium]